MKLLVGILIGIGIVVAGAVLVAWKGTFDVSASKPPSLLEEKLGLFVLDRSVERHARNVENPLRPSPEVLSEGLAHYRSNCLPCHGAPGVEAFEFGKGLNPPAPDLTEQRSRSRPDGELFWITRNGIRMTGMPSFGPTHSDQEIWTLVTFVRHLDELSSEERVLLKAALEAQEHHHEPAPPAGEGDHGHPPGTPPHAH